MKVGDKLSCDVCGVEVTCTKDCGCMSSHFVCCGKPMKTHKKPKSVKKNKGRKKG